MFREAEGRGEEGAEDAGGDGCMGHNGDGCSGWWIQKKETGGSLLCVWKCK